MKSNLKIVKGDGEVVKVNENLYEILKKLEEADACYQIGMKVARKVGDNHAYNELQSAYRSFQGLDEDDEY